jgi:hypothetical protein
MNVTRSRRPLAVDKKDDGGEEISLLDAPYSPKEAPSHVLTQRPLASTTSKSDSLFDLRTWIVQDAVLGKEKATSRSLAVGPLQRLGGGLERLTRIECFILAGLTLLATVVRLWRIDRVRYAVRMKLPKRLTLFRSSLLLLCSMKYTLEARK